MPKSKPVFDYNICMCCTACIYTCPLGCIEKKDISRNKQIDSAPTLIIDNKCNSCGMCVKACPVEAITL